MNDVAVRRAWWATLLIFLLHGLIVSTWISRIPAIQISLHLNNGVLGLTLLGSAVGAVTTIPLTGALVNRFGSRAMSFWATVFLSIALIGPALAKNAVTLTIALFFFGAGAAGMDVSMNAQGVEVEKRLRVPTMSRFHGMFSLGAMVGAGIGGAIAASGIRPLPHFVGSAAAYSALAILARPWLLETHAGVIPEAHRLPLSKIPPVLLALSAIGFCILLAEGAMADWTAVYLKQVLDAGQGTAAAGYSVFSAAMAIFRFLGDWITLRLGAFKAVRSGSITGALGLLWALSVHDPLWAMPGFAAVGAGFSVIIPLVFGSGGRVKGISPGAGIATVTGIGYVGYIVGPPTIGFASELFTLRYGLGVVVGCCLITAVLAGSLRKIGSE
jgi:MFS family permease